MTTISRIKKLLFIELDRRFGEFGFRGSSDRFYGQDYYRQFPGGRHSIAPAFYNRVRGLELDSASIGIRFDDVENLVARFEDPHPPIGPKDVEVRATIGTRLEPKSILAVFRKSWILVEEEDVVKAAEEYVPRTMKRAAPFWERFSNAEEVFRLLSGDLKEAREYSLPDASTIEKAIALALILYGKDKARAVANEKLAILQGETKEQVNRWVGRALST